jgi:hypothetical protein
MEPCSGYNATNCLLQDRAIILTKNYWLSLHVDTFFTYSAHSADHQQAGCSSGGDKWLLDKNKDPVDTAQNGPSNSTENKYYQ